MRLPYFRSLYEIKPRYYDKKVGMNKYCQLLELLLSDELLELDPATEEEEEDDDELFLLFFVLLSLLYLYLFRLSS